MKVRTALACTTAGLAAWCSLGTIGLVGADLAPTKVAVLPPWWLLPVFVVGALAAVRVARLSAEQVSPLFASAIILLPWLPFPMPAATLIWTGPFAAMVWLAALVSLVISNSQFTSYKGSRRQACFVNCQFPIVSSPRRAPLAAAAIALALYGASAWWLAPVLPDGDSPHYLVIAQSIVKDGDLQIENNHRRGDYLEYSLLAAAPDYLRRGVNGAIYSIHSPGLPAIIAPVYWLCGYAGVVAFLGLIAALSTGLMWRFAYQATGSAAAAWFGWACCALTTPFFFQATQVFPDGIAATCVLLGVAPLFLREDKAGHYVESAIWLLAGVSLAILPWLQTRLAVVAAAAAVCLCLRIRSVRHLIAFAIAPAISAVGWFSYFHVLYGTFNPAAPYGPFTQTSVSNLVHGLPGILFDQQFGLFANAPVYGIVFAGVLLGVFRKQRWSLELLALAVPYTIGVGMYAHWWGGTSVPARLIAPLALVAGTGAARVWHDAKSTATRTLLVAALAVSVLITAVMTIPERGRLLFNVRGNPALWLEWSNDLVNIPAALPSLFTDTPVTAPLKIGIWIAMVAIVWFALRALERLRPSSAFSSAAIWSLAAGVMLTVALVWQIDDVQARTPATSEVALLRDDSTDQALAFDFGTRHLDPVRDVQARVRVRSSQRRQRTGPQELLSASAVPPGTYLLLANSRGAQGVLTMRVGSNPLPFLVVPLPLSDPAPAVRFPVAVQSLVIEGDRAVSGVELAPVSPGDFPGLAGESQAHRGAHFASGDAFFLDDNAYPEPTGFWVAGARTARVVLTTTGEAITLALRNSPIENTVTIDVEGTTQDVTLGPDEERVVTIKLNRQVAPTAMAATMPYAAVRISSRSGFRPSRADSGNRDLRYLGCWVELR